MRLRVTKPITKHGRVYRYGEVIEDASSTERSLGRLHKWETLPDPEPAISSLRKPQLVQLAEDRGLDPTGLTVPELREQLAT